MEMTMRAFVAKDGLGGRNERREGRTYDSQISWMWRI